MTAPLIDSDIFLLLWSSNAPQSEWIRNEWLTALNFQKNIIVVAAQEDLNLPSELRKVPVIPIVNYNRGLEELCENFKQTKVPERISILPAKTWGPLEHNSNYQGNPETLLDLYSYLLQMKWSLLLSQNLSPLKGSAKLKCSRNSLPLWPGLSKWNYLAQCCRELGTRTYTAAEDLGLIASSLPGEDNSVGFTRLATYLQKRNDTLIILDNLREPAILEKEMVPGFSLISSNAYILCTTKQYKLPENLVAFEINLPDASQGYQLMVQKQEPQDPEEIKIVEKIVAGLGCFPLSIKLARIFMDKKRLPIPASIRA